MNAQQDIILIDRIDEKSGTVAFVMSQAAPFLKARSTDDIDDLYERKQTRRGQLTIVKRGDYWWVQQSNAYVAGKGFGTDLYIAAISWASSHGKGIVSAIPLDDSAAYVGLTKVSPDAMKARERIKARGVDVTPGHFFRQANRWTFDPNSTTHNGVVMTGDGSQRFPVVDMGRYWE